MMELEAIPAVDIEYVTPKYIVGIGASAGGLNALEQFFDKMPSDSGMAFVVIQHLSPDFKSLMDDLLARHTSMRIHRVTNGMELQSNSVYLIPPKTYMTVKAQKLYLTEKVASQHMELPIDIFFNSLAADVAGRAVGVILSGTGSDGSRGVVSISRHGGLVISQTLESAQFDGMPRNAVASGVCNFVLPPERMPHVLMEYILNPVAVRTKMSRDFEVIAEEGEFAQIFALLRRSYNLDFSKYKCTTVERRIRRRMEFRKLSDISDYASIISGDPNELDALYKDLLIGVTEFFRDRQSFDFLEKEIIPSLFLNLESGQGLRVWSAACATGEEAYSLAILLMEQAEIRSFSEKITVFASDVHKTSLDFASQGLYDRERLGNMSPERLERFFKKEGHDQHRITSELRKMVVFAQHNLLSDPPFTRMDLICCRNLLIYFQPEAQEKAISLFHFALRKAGVLFLGSSEGLGTFSGEFEVVASQHKLFRKIRDLKLAVDLESVRPANNRGVQATLMQPAFPRTVSIDRQVLADYDRLLGRHMPPGVLIDENRSILHYFGNVSEYLKLPAGRAESDILRLVEDNLHIALTTAIQRVASAGQAFTTRNVRVACGDEEQMIDLTVAPLPDEKTRATHYHIFFERVRDFTPSPCPEPRLEDAPEQASFDAIDHYRQHINDLMGELQSTRENLQTTIEELQTSNEELQATNEELLAANEELQSTNEELHSVNEELYSVNSEFERKNLELKQLNTDHENLLASTDIGTIFLDRQLRIRKFNPAISAFFKLLPRDIGRPIDHIVYHLANQDEMLADIQRVLTDGNMFEKEERSRDGRFLLNRVLPFKTEGGQVEGVVLTFTDISKIKEAELRIVQLNEDLERKVAERTKELKDEVNNRREAERRVIESRDYYLNILKNAPALIWRAGTDAKCDWFNEVWLEFTGRSMEQELGNGWTEGVYPEDFDACLKTYLDSFGRHEQFEMEYRLRRHDGEYRWILDIGRPFQHLDNTFAGYIGYCFDITERKKNEAGLANAKRLAETASKSKSEFLANMSHEIRTPMNAVLGLAHLALQTELTSKQHDYLEKIQSSGQLLLGVINDILDFSKIEAGRLELERTPFRLGKVFNHLAAMVEMLAEQKGLRFRINIAADVPDRLVGDPLRLGQVLLNLTNNAIKFTETGEVVASVASVEAAQADHVHLRFSVKDTGIGIAPENHACIFDFFTQADGSTTRHYGGTGLGLAISRHIVRMMGGDIFVDSKVGCGSTFMFTAPFVIDNSPANSSTDSAQTSTGQSNLKTLPFSAVKVLVADDNTINQQLMAEFLRNLGIDVDIAGNGRKAIELLRERGGRYAAVLMDIQMPGMDGYEAARLIRGELGMRSLPIIAVTAHAFESERQRCLDAGINDHISKPIVHENLLATLQRWIPQAGDAAACRTQSATQIGTDLNDAVTFDPPGVNMAELLKRIQFNQTFAFDLLMQFRSLQSGMLMAIAKSISDGNFTAARENTHALRGAACNLSLEDVAAAAADLEKAFELEDADAIASKMKTLDAATAKVVNGLDNLPFQARGGDTAI